MATLVLDFEGPKNHFLDLAKLPIELNNSSVLITSLNQVSMVVSNGPLHQNLLLLEFASLRPSLEFVRNGSLVRKPNTIAHNTNIFVVSHIR